MKRTTETTKWLCTVWWLIFVIIMFCGRHFGHPIWNIFDKKFHFKANSSMHLSEDKINWRSFPSNVLELDYTLLALVVLFICENSFVYYLLTHSIHTISGWSLVKSFSDTECFISEEYSVWFCYSLKKDDMSGYHLASLMDFSLAGVTVEWHYPALMSLPSSSASTDVF